MNQDNDFDKYLPDTYFNWIMTLVMDDKHKNYTKLLSMLHHRSFEYSLFLDENRNSDGLNLRYRFGYDYGYDRDTISEYLLNTQYLPLDRCTVLEMIVALLLRINENIYDYTDSQFKIIFWELMGNIQVLGMNDNEFDEDHVSQRLDIALRRRYLPNGFGGLFPLNRTSYDLRTVEIWKQALWYLDERENLQHVY